MALANTDFHNAHSNIGEIAITEKRFRVRG